MTEVDQLREVLASQPAVKLAVLFGSRARGRSGPASDFDLGLLLAPDSLDHRQRIELAAARAVSREIDFVYLEEAPPLVRFQIARDGVVLVEKEPRRWPRFKARAMVDWWDWAPVARKIHAAYTRNLRAQLADGRP